MVSDKSYDMARRCFRRIIPLVLAIAGLISAGSCTKEKVWGRAHIMMTFGFNNLSSYLAEDVRDLEDGFIPGNDSGENLLFVFSHNTSGGYAEKTSPVLYRLYRDRGGNVVKEELLRLDEGSIPNTKENITLILNYIKEKYTPVSCGVLMSSHGTGWIPPGYSSSPQSYENSVSSVAEGCPSAAERLLHPIESQLSGIVPYSPVEGEIPVRSFGATVTDDKGKEAYETDIRELAEGIPYKLDYLIFDACFMGGVEVAYELKDKCRLLCVSQTEILGDGMDYKTMLSHLLGSDCADLLSVSKEYFENYDTQSGVWRSATISLIDCSALTRLAAVCNEIFSAHEISTDTCDSRLLQQYFRSTYKSQHGWFYDLGSIAEAAGATEDELQELDSALGECIIWQNATPYFMNDFRIRTHCGLSMYLPYPERAYLNNYYKTLAWNETTGLIR